MLRSVSNWSLGMDPEESIHTAWADAISRAQHFVYIENQFFISANGGNGVQNGIGDALINRISRAIAARCDASQPTVFHCEISCHGEC